MYNNNNYYYSTLYMCVGVRVWEGGGCGVWAWVGMWMVEM